LGETDVRVAADMMVSVCYRLLDELGELADEVSAAEPLVYIHGHAQVIPGLEAGLEGAALGEKRSLACEPDMAFGEPADDALLEIDKGDLPDGATAEEGAEVVFTSPTGEESVHRIVALRPDSVIVDLNHPLAGQHVTFEAEVCALRPATDEELDAAIVSASTIVYGTEPAAGLIQLRRKPADEEKDEQEGQLGRGGQADS
jgi:FKBP-type peptidyl-prolyl cis-trans isomerase SlyD